MIRQEGYFEYLMALAAAGQTSEIELEQLHDHATGCSSCAQRMAEMESINLQLFLALTAQVKREKISSRMRERFRIRAAQSGVPIAAPSFGIQGSHLVHFAALLVVVCLFVGIGWRCITDRSSGRTVGSYAPLKSGGAPQLLATAHPDSAPSPVRAAEHSIVRRRNQHALANVAILSSLAPREEPSVVPRPLFRLDPALFPSKPRALNGEAKAGGLQYLPAEYFLPREGRLTPGFSDMTLRGSSANGDPDHRVFRYSSTLASLSLQDDQAVFGLKPRVRDLSFNSTLDSNRSR